MDWKQRISFVLIPKRFLTDKELALEMGCNDFVTKPVSERTLRKALDKYSTIV